MSTKYFPLRIPKPTGQKKYVPLTPIKPTGGKKYWPLTPPKTNGEKKYVSLKASSIEITNEMPESVRREIASMKANGMQVRTHRDLYFRPVLEQTPNKDHLPTIPSTGKTNPDHFFYRAVFSGPRIGHAIVLYYVPQYTPPARPARPTPPHHGPYVLAKPAYELPPRHVIPWTGRRPARDFREELVVDPRRFTAPFGGGIPGNAPPISLPLANHDFAVDDLTSLWSRRRELLFGIHGAGECHVQGAINRVMDWGYDKEAADARPPLPSFADQNNVVVAAPEFSRWFDQLPAGFVFPSDYVSYRNREYTTRFGWPEPGSQADICLFLGWYVNATGNTPADFTRDWRIGWDENLHGFQLLLNKENTQRSDEMLNVIWDVFREDFNLGDKMNLYGHSGGSQFVNHYMMVHPEKVQRAAFSGGGSYLFPRFDKVYPYGLDCSKIHDDGFGGTNPPPDYAVDLRQMTDKQWMEKIAKLHLFPRIVFVGKKDIEQDLHADRVWQGKNRYTKALNYTAEMLRMGWLIRNHSNAVWPSEANFPMLLRLVNEEHSDSRNAAQDWLQKWWWTYPRVTPYDGRGERAP